MDLKALEGEFLGKKFAQSGAVAGKEFTEADVKAKSDMVRILPPDSMTTYDYWEDRINIHLDSNNICTSVNLG